MNWAASTDVEEFSEAAAWLLARIPMPKSEWEKLDAFSQRKAFTVAGVAQADLIRDVLLQIDRAVVNGTTLEDFKKGVGQQLIDAWAGSVSNPAWRIETIFRTNAQAAYNAGRFKQQSNPTLLKVRPFWQFDAVLDNRTSLMCEKSDGTILSHDDPWWKTHYPPLHFGCRSIVRSLRRSQAEAKGITKDPAKEPAQEGFGGLPNISEWQPELQKYPPQIREELRRRLQKVDRPKATPKPKLSPKPSKPKPEWAVEHWKKQFKAKYGDAASAMAWGRAMQERGLDLTVKRGTELAKKYGFDNFADLLAMYPSGTLRDVPLNNELNAPIAAILGHLNNVDAKSGTIKVVSQKNPEKAILWFDTFLNKNVDARVVLEWTAGRAECDVLSNPPIARASKFNDIIHEFGHAIEELNLKIKASAKAFLAARTIGEKPEYLNNIFKTTIYDPWETAKPDKFCTPYCGKIYSQGWTELLSIGVEKLATDPFMFYIMDVEHFWWVLGCLGGSA